MVNTRRVLIVEDNLDSSVAFRTLVSIWGYEPRYAFDGPSALSVAEEFEPEIILLDLGLPGLDGFEVAQKLRHLRYVAQPVIIAITGRSEPETKERAQASGIDYFVVKPGDPERIRYLLAYGKHLVSEDGPSFRKDGSVDSSVEMPLANTIN